jgi:rhodanese-related sulfurtransferase
MKQNQSVLIALLVLTLTSFTPVCADAPAPHDEAKKTSVGLYIDASEAAKWFNEKKAVIIDVRSPEEFLFVGHTGIAPNIPFQLWKGEFIRNNGKTQAKMVENPTFVQEVQKKFKPEEIILVMCRSGQRSAPAVEALREAGFQNVYNMLDGFEGDLAKEGPKKGKREVNGWKNAGNPWTYSINDDLIWAQSK